MCISAHTNQVIYVSLFLSSLNATGDNWQKEEKGVVSLAFYDFCAVWNLIIQVIIKYL